MIISFILIRHSSNHHSFINQTLTEGDVPEVEVHSEPIFISPVVSLVFTIASLKIAKCVSVPAGKWRRTSGRGARLFKLGVRVRIRSAAPTARGLTATRRLCSIRFAVDIGSIRYESKEHDGNGAQVQNEVVEASHDDLKGMMNSLLVNE
jgi:hypothetical protein